MKPLRSAGLVPSNSPISIAFALFLATFLLFSRSLANDFVSFDDPGNVTLNPHMQNGLTVDGVRWAFTSIDYANWHPLTWLSFLIDCQLFGLEAWGYHLTNVGLHAANAALLFGVLYRMTKAPWGSACVAALFAVHPLHVESVAWVTERKDVLSTFFGLACLGVYVLYTEKRSLARYLGVLVLLALSLMSKPMLVTLPFLLLLIDYWPLGRFGGRGFAANASRNLGGSTVSLRRLLLEKIPLLVLVAASCAITVVAQHRGEAVRSLQHYPLPARIMNAGISVLTYARKMVWPDDLAVFYPHPRSAVPVWKGATALALILGVTALVWRQRERRPYLLVGWLWYVGTLVPVIGLVQVGDQALADRYTYVPLVGLFLIVGWGLNDLTESWRNRNWVLAAVAAVTLASCSIVTWVQQGYWYDGVALWAHAAEVVPGNDVAENNLGLDLRARGNAGEGITHLSAALKINPTKTEALANLASALAGENRLNEAVHYLEELLHLAPGNSQAHSLLGSILDRQGKLHESVAELSKAVELKPGDAEVHAYLGVVLQKLERPEEAAGEFSLAIRINPRLADAYYRLGMLRLRQGRKDEAVKNLKTAADLAPDNIVYRCDLALAFARQGLASEATDNYRRALESKPNWPAASNRQAWFLATHPDSSVRQGARALELAEEACQATENRNPEFLDTLAAAYAETGHFAEAVSAADSALALAGASGRSELAAQIHLRRKSYSENRPHRETGTQPSALPKPVGADRAAPPRN